ncbi:MAG: acyl-phosphate glycerol 3-phosphate acyltransferase [Denitrovibrio sp.]|nr:MAG: acyl-phosphate glycerol 3-phosphate acyltransferase [Denitrovibrio sp.]
MIYLIIILCYLIGSVPTAYILVKKLKGVDIRTVGSGNVGASNAARILGKWGFIVVLTIDVLKGMIPVLVVRHFYGESDYALLAAVAVVLGHTFTIFLNFKGGKGVATALGVFIALAPLPTLIAALAFFAMLALFRMISLSSITAAVTIAISVWFLSDWSHLRIFTIIIAALVIFLHKGNIDRILKGTERKVGKKSA